MSKLKSPVLWASVVATVGLVMMMAVAERTRLDVRRSSDRVSHTLDVQKAFNLVLKSVLDAETAQRGYLLTGSQVYLAPYSQSQSAMPLHLAELGRVTAGDAHHSDRVARLQTLVADKMRELRETVALAERGDLGAAQAVVRTDRGRRLMEGVRSLLDRAFVDEQRVLRQRQADLEDALFRRALLAYGVAIVLIAAVAAAIHLHVRLQRLQSLVTLCAWSKTVQDGDEWVSFEEYLERRYDVRVTHGLSPDELEKLNHQLLPR